jgi:hypothetical protein
VSSEFPIDKVRRAKRILLKGAAADEIRWAFDYLVETAGIADPYDGRLPAAAAEALLKSPLATIPDESLRRLTATLGDTITGIALFKIAELLVLLPREHALKYLGLARQAADPAKHLYNAASLLYVQAMHGDEHARREIVALARHEAKKPGYLQSYYVRVLKHFPGDDGEAEWYFGDGYRLWVPREFVDKIDTADVARTLEGARLPREQFITRKCRTEFAVKEPRTGIVYLRPPGSFLTEYGRYSGWKALAPEQHAAAARLMSELSAEEKTLLLRTLAGLYHLEDADFTVDELLLGWLENPAPFRLFP